jgi:O-antigen ligase
MLHDRTRRIASTMGHPNNMGGYIVMGLPMICYFRMLAFKEGSFLKGIALIAVELVGSVLVVFSFSRGAWVAMFVMMLVFIVNLAVFAEKKQVVFLAVIPWVIGFSLGIIYSPALKVPLSVGVNIVYPPDAGKNSFQKVILLYH